MSSGILHPVILSGGAGTRLWPLSRAALPKQFLALHGPHTMMQDTALRAAAVPGAASPILVCGEDHRFIVAEHMQRIGVTPAAIILEPVGRNTAPAAAIAALAVAERDPQGIVALLSSDHVVGDRGGFAKALEVAAGAARAGSIVVFAITPTAPETGYGYVERGTPLPEHDGAFRVQRFTEKPDAATAATFIASGNYGWNSGMFVFRADVMLAELERHAPDVVRNCREAWSKASRSVDFTRLEPTAFGRATDISLDYALMEKTDKAAVVPSAMEWSDVGSWSALWDLTEKDDDGNVFQGDVVSLDTKNSFVHSETRLTALAGVEDLVVVVTEDAVLVCDRERSGDVKAIVDRLTSTNRKEAAEHKRVVRPWGSYVSVNDGDKHQVKEIVVNPGGRLSLQMHHKRAEHWIVVQGIARVTRNDEIFELKENEATYIPQGARHRLENLGEVPLHLIEVQYGSYLGEDDIVRFDDVYGRTGR